MVEIDDRLRIGVGLDHALVEEERPGAHRFHQAGVVAHEADRLPGRLELVDLPDAPVAKDRVPDGERFVHEEHVGIDVDGGREGQPHEHPARVGLHRLIDEVPDLREGLDRREPLEHLLAPEAHDRAVHEHVLAAGELGVEAGAQLEQRGDAALHAHLPARRPDDPGDDLEERALARAVHADDAEGRAARDLDAHVPERPQLVVVRPAAAPQGLQEPMAGVRVDPVGLGDRLDPDAGRPHHKTSTKACFERRKTQWPATKATRAMAASTAAWERSGRRWSITTAR